MGESIAVALRRAADLTAAGDPAAAINLLHGVLGEHPANSEAWCRLSAAQLDAGDAESSLDAAKEAIRLGERSWAHRLASLALLELGRTGEAVVSARESVRRDPTDWRCHVALAEALATDAPEESLAAAGRAVALARNEARPFEVLGDAAMCVNDRETARAAYLHAIRIDPVSQHARANLVRLGRSTLGPTTTPAAPEPPPQPRRFGRIEQVGVSLAARRAGFALAAGALLLVLAGMPQPSGVHGWIGLVLAVFAVGLLVPAWFRFLRGVPVNRVWRQHLVLSVAVGLFGLAVLLLTLWTVLVAFGARTLSPLTLVLVSGLASGTLSAFALWRANHTGR